MLCLVQVPGAGGLPPPRTPPQRYQIPPPPLPALAPAGAGAGPRRAGAGGRVILVYLLGGAGGRQPPRPGHLHQTNHQILQHLLPYPLAARGVVAKLASPQASQAMAAILLGPSSSPTAPPQAPEASFRPVASEWVTPHSYRVFGLSESLPKALALPLRRRVRACSCISKHPQPF